MESISKKGYYPQVTQREISVSYAIIHFQFKDDAMWF